MSGALTDIPDLELCFIREVGVDGPSSGSCCYERVSDAGGPGEGGGPRNLAKTAHISTVEERIRTILSKSSNAGQSDLDEIKECDVERSSSRKSLIHSYTDRVNMCLCHELDSLRLDVE